MHRLGSLIITIVVIPSLVSAWYSVKNPKRNNILLQKYRPSLGFSQSALAMVSSISLDDSPLQWQDFLNSVESSDGSTSLLWDQVQKEANHAVSMEPAVGSQLYQGILSHTSLLEAIVTIVAHEIETELMPATVFKNLFMESLTKKDESAIHRDVASVAMCTSDGSIMTAVLFHKGLHALVCHRVGHRLWEAGRTGLAYYLQSTVSRKFSADIHPAAQIGSGIYLVIGGGIVIGETAVVGNDTCILQGVTLGGTGKETGDRHPKVGNGVILHPGCSVLGNIVVGDGAIVSPKSIVTKAVPPLARVRGVPARIESYREATEEEFNRSDLCRTLAYRYKDVWEKIVKERHHNAGT